MEGILWYDKENQKKIFSMEKYNMGKDAFLRVVGRVLQSNYSCFALQGSGFNP